jgi:hypothetical protein
MTEEIHNTLDALDKLLDAGVPEQKDADLLAAIAYTLTSLSWSSLRLAGANVNEHPVKREIERVKLYMQKIKE